MSGAVGFYYKVSFPEFKADAFEKQVRENCHNALLKAARKFLLAAVPRIPVFTGFARGSFGNLEDVAGQVSGGRIDARRGGYTKANNYARRAYYYYPSKGNRIIRNTITGRQFSTPPNQIFAQGRAKIAKDETVIFFRFSVDISYVNYLDRAKWGAFKAGVDAFNAEIRSQLDKLIPDMGKYLITRDIK